MEELLAVAREIDEYAGAAADVVPAVGMVAFPLRLLAALRQVLARLDEHGIGFAGTSSYEDGSE